MSGLCQAPETLSGTTRFAPAASIASPAVWTCFELAADDDLRRRVEVCERHAGAGRASLQRLAHASGFEPEHRRHSAARALRRLLHRLAAFADDAQRVVELERLGDDETAELGERVAGGNDGRRSRADGA